LFGTGAERRKEQIWRQIEQLLFGVALSPRCIAAKDRSPPIAASRRCDLQIRQSISHNTFAITASHKVFVTVCSRTREGGGAKKIRRRDRDSEPVCETPPATTSVTARFHG
jgi:hypothetical protein